LGAHAPLYLGLSIMGAVHLPLYLGLSIMGASHAPSSASSQSSGLAAAGSLIICGSLSSQSSGFFAAGSTILASSTQSAGFLSEASSISLVGKRDHWPSPRLPLAREFMSTSTSYVLSGLMTSVYKCVNSFLSFHSSLMSSFLSMLVPSLEKMRCTRDTS